MDEPGLDLAGLLATRVMRVLQAQGEDPVDKETDLPLPVAICPGGEAGWHWAASCVMVDPDMADLVGHRRRTRVMDSSWIGRAAARPWPVMLASATFQKKSRAVMLGAALMSKPWSSAVCSMQMWVSAPMRTMFCALCRRMKSSGSGRTGGKGGFPAVFLC